MKDLLLIRRSGMILLSLMCCPISRAQDARPVADEFMRRFAQQAEQFMPGFMTPVSAEQLQQLENVELSLREEAEYGSRTLAQYEQMLKQQGKSLQRRGRDVEYLEKLVTTVQLSMRQAKRYRRVQIYVVETAEADAYSIPGGHLLFTTGLLETAGSEAAVVGVVAHELSHLDRGHQLYAIKQAKLLKRRPDFRNMMTTISAMAKPFHAEFESQADADAFAWMVRAGYDPRELARLLQRWDQTQNTEKPWLEMMPTFARTHPDAGIRAQAILEQSAMLPRARQRLVAARKNLGLRVPHSEKAFPE